MSSAAAGGSRWRNNPFSRESASPSPGPTKPMGRPISTVMTPSPQAAHSTGHNRNHSFSPMGSSNLAPASVSRQRSISNRSGNRNSNTFAPSFIKSESLQPQDEHVGGIEGENDFSGKRYVWLRDPQTAFVKGWIIEERDGKRILVQCDDGSVSYG